MQRRISLLSLLFLLVVSACDSTDPAVRVVTGIYVGNQGNFADNNGSVTVYDPATGQTNADAIPNLGGLVQNILIDGDRAFVLLNFDDSFSTGHGRIDIVDLNTNQRTAQIDVNTPRSAVLEGNTLWVSNLYANTVTPIDLITNTPGTPIDVGSNPEGLVMASGNLFVANNGFGESTTVSVIDMATRTVSQTLDIGCDGPRNLSADGDGDVWVFCTGKTIYDEDFNIIGQTNGAAVVLNGATGSEIDRTDLDAQLGGVGGAIGQDAFMVAGRNEAWAVKGAQLLRFDTATNMLVETITPQIPANHFIGAVGYDEVNDRLLIGAVLDYVSAGTVVIANRAGAEVASFTAGIAPTTVVVREGEQ